MSSKESWFCQTAERGNLRRFPQGFSSQHPLNWEYAEGVLHLIHSSLEQRHQLGTCSRTKRNSKHGSEALKSIGVYNNVGKHCNAFSVPQQRYCKQYFPDVKTRLMLASMLKAPAVLFLQDRGIKVDVNHLSWLRRQNSPESSRSTVQQYNRQRCNRDTEVRPAWLQYGRTYVEVIGKDGRSNCNVRMSGPGPGSNCERREVA